MQVIGGATLILAGGLEVARDHREGHAPPGSHRGWATRLLAAWSLINIGVVCALVLDHVRLTLSPPIRWVPLDDLTRGHRQRFDGGRIVNQVLSPVINPGTPSFVLTSQPLERTRAHSSLLGHYHLVTDFGDRFAPLHLLPRRWGTAFLASSIGLHSEQIGSGRTTPAIRHNLARATEPGRACVTGIVTQGPRRHSPGRSAHRTGASWDLEVRQRRVGSDTGRSSTPGPTSDASRHGRSCVRRRTEPPNGSG